jgi:hypothetical protein
MSKLGKSAATSSSSIGSEYRSLIPRPPVDPHQCRSDRCGMAHDWPITGAVVGGELVAIPGHLEAWPLCLGLLAALCRRVRAVGVGGHGLLKPCAWEAVGPSGHEWAPTGNSSDPPRDGLHRAGVLRPVDPAPDTRLGRDSRRDHPHLPRRRAGPRSPPASRGACSASIAAERATATPRRSSGRPASGRSTSLTSST